MNDLMPTTAGTAFDDNSSSSGAGLAGGAETVSTARADSPPTAAEEPSLASLRLSDGADAGVARYCDRFFTNPESARSGSKALLTAFEDNGAWLSSLMQPSQLVAEVRQSCCALTSHVIMHWINQGETHKLARLADALLDASPPLATHEAGQIMALLASILGILRPLRAQNLRAAALPLLEDPLDAKLRTETEEWVEIGSSLRDLPPDERLFWNRRLREPDEDWEWESAESCAALKALAPLLRQKPKHSERFQRLVPGCWWELLHATRPLPATDEAPTKPTARRGLAPGSLLVGALLGAAGAAGFGWWGGLQHHELPRAETAPQAPIAARPPADLAKPPLPPQPATPGIRTSGVTPLLAPSAPIPPAPKPPPASIASNPHAKPLVVSKPGPQPEAPKPSPLETITATPALMIGPIAEPLMPAHRKEVAVSPPPAAAAEPETPESKPQLPTTAKSSPAAPPAPSQQTTPPTPPAAIAATTLPPTNAAPPPPATPPVVSSPPPAVEPERKPETPAAKPPPRGPGVSFMGSAIAAKAAPSLPPLSPADTWRSSKHPMVTRRIAAVEALAQEYPRLRRLHALVKSGSYRENETLVQGRSSVMPAKGPEYSAFLRWILLEPPRDDDTSTLAAKLAIRTMSPADTFSVLELISYPGSPNEAQGREIAGILLSLEADSLSRQQRTTLERLVEANP